MAEPNEKTYTGSIERLRAPERIKKLEIHRVTELTLNKCPADSLLDIGTGSAVFAQAFAGVPLHVTGIDVNDEMLAEARRLVSDACFCNGSMENIPFGNHSFDIVFMAHVLHEADDIIAALAEAARVVRLRVAVLEWPYRDETSGPPLKHRLSEKAVVHAAEQAGLLKIDIVHLDYMVLYLMDCK